MNTAQKGRSDLKLASLRRDRELGAARPRGRVRDRRRRPAARRSPLLLDELRLLLSAEDEAFLFKS